MTATASARTDRPFLPADIAVDRALVRAATAFVLSAARGTHNGSPASIAQRTWPRDRACLDVLQRAAVTPATATTSGWASPLGATAVVGFITGLAPSAAGQLLASGLSLSL